MDNQCKICTNKVVKFEFEYDKEISYYRCENCGYFFRLPDDYWLDYQNDYMSEELIPKSKKLAKNYFKRLSSEIPEDGVCLDFGGSFGFFGKLLQEKKKCSVRNIEASNYASNYSNNQGVICFKTLSELDIKSFDFIFIFHVIEHIKPDELNDFIGQMTSMLNPAGKLIILMPSADSAKLSILKKHYAWLAPDEHIGFFSTRTIKHIITDLSNFKIESYSASPAAVHYPIFSILSKLRRNAVKSTAKDLQDKGKRTFRSKVILSIKRVYNLAIIGERYLFLPFYKLYDLFSSEKDELVIIIEKKN